MILRVQRPDVLRVSACWHLILSLQVLQLDAESHKQQVDGQRLEKERGSKRLSRGRRMLRE